MREQGNLEVMHCILLVNNVLTATGRSVQQAQTGSTRTNKNAQQYIQIGSC